MRFDKLRAGLFFGLMLVAAGTNATAQKAAADPVRLAAARELVQASGGADQAYQGMARMRDAMLAQMKLRNPAMAAKVESFMRSYFSKSNPKTSEFLDAIVESLTKMYAQKFTAAELKQVTAFQNSAIGRKFNSLAPQMIASLAPQLMSFQKGFIRDIQAHMRANQAKPQ